VSGPGPRAHRTMSGALRAALAAAEVTPADAAAVQLARVLAKAIDDDPSSAAAVSPKLLAVLAQLGMTPVGRRSPSTGQSASAPAEEGADREHALAAIRARRAERTAPR